jgi:hypothetical protein
MDMDTYRIYWEVRVYDEFDDPEGVSCHSFQVLADSFESANAQGHSQLIDELDRTYPDKTHGTFINPQITGIKNERTGESYDFGKPEMLDGHTLIIKQI